MPLPQTSATSEVIKAAHATGTEVYLEPESSKGEPSKGEPSKGEPSKPESSKGEPSKPTDKSDKDSIMGRPAVKVSTRGSKTTIKDVIPKATPDAHRKKMRQQDLKSLYEKAKRTEEVDIASSDDEVIEEPAGTSTSAGTSKSTSKDTDNLMKILTE